MSDPGKLQVGDSVTLVRRITEQDVELFSEMAMDKNAMHFDEAFAAKSIFGRRIAHGMTGAALISGGLTRLMGDGNIWLSMEIRFEKPIFIGDELSCILTIQELDRRGVATIRVEILNPRREKVISGVVGSMRASARAGGAAA
jgi:acyl dehydratase